MKSATFLFLFKNLKQRIEINIDNLPLWRFLAELILYFAPLSRTELYITHETTSNS